MSKDMNREDFEKSLARLQGMAKSQLFHTPSDSEPGTWAGSNTTEEQGHEDGIDENGTDYDGVKKSLAAKVSKSKALTPAEVAIVKGTNPYPAIGLKISKGQKLTAAESWALKGGRAIFKSEEAKGPSGGAMKVSPSDTPSAGDETGADGVPPTNAGSDAEDKHIERETAKGLPDFLKDKDEEDAAKSLRGAAGRGAHLSKGLEMSPILAEFVQAFGHAMKGQEARIVHEIAKSLAPVFSRLSAVEKSTRETSDISKALAGAVAGIGEHVAAGADQAASGAHLPASGPRSQLRAVAPNQGGVNAIEKSMPGPGGLDIGSDAMAKSQVVEAMTEMVKSNQLPVLEVIKFESSGQISPAVQQKVSAFINKSRG